MYKWHIIRSTTEYCVDEDNKIVGEVIMDASGVKATAYLTDQGILGVYLGMLAAKKAVENALREEEIE